ncbi:MAG: hypothetical protein E7517_09265 [Ruminococcaceae bacterium]|nr:hypothetical protein [Oscillospiraceae bacterium]
MFKKIVSLLLVTVLLMVSLDCAFIVFAANSESVESFIDSVEELNSEEAEEEKTLEESAGSRVIVKATQKPETFGDAQYFKGTYGKHIFQYATADEATEAVNYYDSLPYVRWATKDSLVDSYDMPYGPAMLGTQRAREYIVQNDIPVSDIKVAIVDTGIDFVADLYRGNPRIINSGVNVTNSGKKNSAQDDQFHGSLCTEIVMENTPDSVSIIGYKALNYQGSGTHLWVATCIEKAVEDGADVINLSLGSVDDPCYSGTSNDVIIDAVNLALSNGVIVVAAAGNEGHNADYCVPANIEGVFTVGAIDRAGNKAFFSNYGQCVDFVAPGVKIEFNYDQAFKNGVRVSGKVKTPQVASGTSFSSPFIVAEAATLLSVDESLTAAQVKNRLQNVAIPYEQLTYHDGFHPIEEDKADSDLLSGFLRSTVSDIQDKSIYYGAGMPQADVAVQYPSGFERAQSPDFSVDSGHYIDEEFDLEITSPNAEIYYTQDESYPTRENGKKYEGAIHLDELQSFRAVAFCEGKAPSYYAAREYKIDFHVPETDFEFQRYQLKTDFLGKRLEYRNVFTCYNGTRKGIIVPATYKGLPVEKVDIGSIDNYITSITIPDTVKYVAIGQAPAKKNVKKLVSLTTNAPLERLSVNHIYESLVELNAPNVKTLSVNDTNVRTLYAPHAIRVSGENAECLKEVYAPLVKDIGKSYQDEDGAWHTEGTFSNCYSLEKVYMPNLEYVADNGFNCCKKLKPFSMDKLQYIGYSGFGGCFFMKEIYCPALKDAGDYALTDSARTLYLPNLEKFDGRIGAISTFAPDYNINYSRYPTKLIVSSKLKEWRDEPEEVEVLGPAYKIIYHHELEIYGTPGSLAAQKANEYNLKFVALPLLESEPENMGANAEGIITAEVLGFNKQIQWYGTDRKDNHGGMALSGENSETLDTSKYPYRYYYCKVKTSDGDYKKNITTGVGNLSYYNYQKDKYINVLDISLLLMYIGQAVTSDNKKYDINEDGVIDIADFSILQSSEIYGKKV